MKILIVAGGTGGHLYPGISVAKKLIEKRHQVLIIIRAKELEVKAVSDAHLEFATIAGTGLKKSLVGLIRFGWQFLKGFGQAKNIIACFNPEVILAMGNYLSLPIAIAGRQRKIPLVLHEQNCLPGKATKFLAKKATAICVSFADSAAYLKNYKSKIVFTGNPIRPEMLVAGVRPRGRKIRNLLVFGGSQGAHSINLAMIEALDRLESVRTKMTITHLSGTKDQLLVEKGYQERNFNVSLAPYLNEMHEAYMKASLVVARAGAATLAELAYFGLPSILIPYPFSIPHLPQRIIKCFQYIGV
jgi:UDP-N-acetylglucosamine--N-acetylmuramyl-(pentapeptide) pyrophosphoryl-undecaprenol N-acetylglucosamine transferase